MVKSPLPHCHLLFLGKMRLCFKFAHIWNCAKWSLGARNRIIGSRFCVLVYCPVCHLLHTFMNTYREWIHKYISGILELRILQLHFEITYSVDVFQVCSCLTSPTAYSTLAENASKSRLRWRRNTTVPWIVVNSVMHPDCTKLLWWLQMPTTCPNVACLAWRSSFLSTPLPASMLTSDVCPMYILTVQCL